MLVMEGERTDGRFRMTSPPSRPSRCVSQCHEVSRTRELLFPCSRRGEASGERTIVCGDSGGSRMSVDVGVDGEVVGCPFRIL